MNPSKKKQVRNLSDEEVSSYCGCFASRPKKNRSEQRRRISRNMFQDYQTKGEEFNETIYSATAVLINLYLSNENDREKIYQILQRCRLNPNLNPNVKQRNDLEYYIPQLINYLVFHEEMSNQQLIDFLIQASQIDFFFAHLVYYQLHSVSAIILPKEQVQLEGLHSIYIYCSVSQFIEQFCATMQSTYTNTLLIAQQLLQEQIPYTNSDIMDERPQIGIPDQTVPIGYKAKDTQNNHPAIIHYGTNYYDHSTSPIHSRDIHLHNYHSITKYPFENEYGEKDCSFSSTIEFWEDLITISERLLVAQPKIISLKADLQRVNARLPAAVYIPFLASSIRNYVVLNIVFNESRVFSTKQRAPYYICLEIFRPEEEKDVPNPFAKVECSRSDLRLSDPRTLKNEMNRHSIIQQKQSMCQQDPDYQPRLRQTLDRIRQTHHPPNQLHVIKEGSNQNSEYEASQRTSLVQQGIAVFYQKPEESQQKSDTVFESFKQLPDDSDRFISLDSHQITPDMPSSQTSNNDQQQKQEQHQQLTGSIVRDFEQMDALQITKIKSLSPQQISDLKTQLFGESESEQKERIRRNSPFCELKSWGLVHLIVKTGDNLKQEQFAMQLISQINQIFLLEELPLTLTTYDVLSLGPSCGIIQMVKDAITMDSLKKSLFEKFRFIKSLRDFFHLYFDNNIREASSNFLHSLVGYSLVCYFLQLKDRHNGNILLHRDGYLIHIDFGFLLSNSPGKGIEFEKKVPFKMLTEYIDIIGGVESQLFERFRRLFFQGFMAIRKHKDRILLLVKMMYSGHGTTLPCFKKGKKTITQLEARFFPEITSERELYVQCQGLINRSIDNWRARWYDKYQYFFQGIFY